MHGQGAHSCQHTLSSLHAGFLCGKCKDDYGVGMLTTDCRKFKAAFPMYYWLMPLLGEPCHNTPWLRLAAVTQLLTIPASLAGPLLVQRSFVLQQGLPPKSGGAVVHHST